MTSSLSNIIAIARRELFWRGRSRAFRITTGLLVVLGVALALAPILFRALDQGGTGDRVEVVVGSAAPAVDVPTALNQVLNAPLTTGLPAASGSPTDVTTGSRVSVVGASDLGVARAHVLDGSSVAALALARDSAGDLTFNLYTKDASLSRRAQLIQQAAISIAVQDRLTRAGIAPGDQAKLFAPPSFAFNRADPNAPAVSGPAPDITSTGATGFALTIALFMMILLYGQWVAYSVVEEKSSRVMEVVLAAATPFQLLAGKVLGVGALAFIQYVIVLVPSILALVFQGQIADAILGSGPNGASAAVALPPGITIPLLLAFGVMLVLGFGLYSVLYAGAASLISRQEDVNQIVAPLTMFSTVGYLVAVWAGTGIVPLDALPVVVLSYIPFFSPYLMLSRVSAGTAGPLEFLLAVILLVLAIPAALWVAARLYRSGVLMYGQRPTPRALVRALRGA